MDVAAATLATILAGAVVVVGPFVSRHRFRRLVAELATDPEARVRSYGRSIRAQWVVVALVVLVGLLARRGAASIGLTGPAETGQAIGIVTYVAVLLGVSIFVMRRRAARIREKLARPPGAILVLLPHTRRERLWFAALCLTAGVCEEVVFRGFGFAYLRWAWPNISDPTTIVATSIAFGLLHLYQGWRGVALTALLGAFVASIVISAGSLIPAMAIHALIDLRLLAVSGFLTVAASPESSSGKRP